MPDRLNAIRTIHHLAASGGTIISKALAAQRNTVLLSEIGPFVGQIRFNPFDPMQQFIRAYLAKDDVLLPNVNRGQFARRVLADRIRVIHSIASQHGRALVLRDHAHSDFMIPSPKRQSSLLLTLAEAELAAISIVTIRAPIDSWLSSLANGWTSGVQSFNDYCERFLALVGGFKSQHIFRYEDFVLDPETSTKRICAVLQLEYDPDFMQRIGDINLTGDSGRRSSVVAPRERRPVSPEMAKEICDSACYAEIACRFGYSSTDRWR